MNKETRNLIENSINDDKGFIKSNNYKLIKLEDDCCEIEGNISSSSLNPYNIAHGGYIFG